MSQALPINLKFSSIAVIHVKHASTRLRGSFLHNRDIMASLATWSDGYLFFDVLFFAKQSYFTIIKSVLCARRFEKQRRGRRRTNGKF